MKNLLIALVRRYAAGRGVAKDERKAVEWWQKAAKQGDAVAQHNLGFMYLTGRGVAQNDRNAVEWWQKAAAQGEENAKKMLESLRRK